MYAAAHRMASEDCMLPTDIVDELALELAIIEELARVDTCTFDALVSQLPGCSWAQVFSTVDRLRREGSVILLRVRSSDHVLSLALC